MLHSCKPLIATTSVIRTVTSKPVPTKLGPPGTILAAKSGSPLRKTVSQGGSNLAT